MRYALLICQDESVASTSEEETARLAAYGAFVEQMGARGVLRGGERLRPTASATTVQVRHGDVVIADGPFAETKEQIGGFFIVDCADIDEAIEVASKIPSALNGTIEVRPLWEM